MDDGGVALAGLVVNRVPHLAAGVDARQPAKRGVSAAQQAQAVRHHTRKHCHSLGLMTQGHSGTSPGPGQVASTTRHSHAQSMLASLPNAGDQPPHLTQGHVVSTICTLRSDSSFISCLERQGRQGQLVHRRSAGAAAAGEHQQLHMPSRHSRQRGQAGHGKPTCTEAPNAGRMTTSPSFTAEKSCGQN